MSTSTLPLSIAPLTTSSASSTKYFTPEEEWYASCTFHISYVFSMLCVYNICIYMYMEIHVHSTLAFRKEKKKER